MLTDELTPDRAPWFAGAHVFAGMVTVNSLVAFDRAFERWRSLYRSALYQRDQARRLGDDHTQPREVHQHAKRDHNVATDLLIALRDGDQGSSSDFNLYRYLATESFLPGYNFPRLPCSPAFRASATKTSRTFNVRAFSHSPSSVHKHYYTMKVVPTGL